MASKKTIMKFLDRAKEMSYYSTFHKQSLGCVFVYRNKIIAEGFNTCKTYPIQKEYNDKYRGFERDSKNNGSLHAEMMCLHKTKYIKNIDWSKVEVYIYREYKKTGLPALAKPCKACMQALKDRGIEKIYYTTDKIFESEVI